MVNMSHIFSFSHCCEAPSAALNPTPTLTAPLASLVRVTPRGHAVELLFPAPAPDEVKWDVVLSLSSMFANASETGTQRDTSDDSDSVWSDVLSLRCSVDLTDSFLTPSLLKGILDYFKRQVNVCFTAESHSRASPSIPFDVNWVGVLEKAAICTCPLVMCVRSLQTCLKRRNNMFLSCITPMHNEEARNEAKRLCEQLICFKMRVLSIDKISILLKLQKKQRSSAPTDVLLSQEADGVQKRVAPKVIVRDIQLDVQFDHAVDLGGGVLSPSSSSPPPSSSKTLKVVKIGGSVYCLEHVSAVHMQSEKEVQSVLDNFISGLFQN
jgi:hypothetical protein